VNGRTAILALVLALAMAGCSGNSAGAPASSSGAASSVPTATSLPASGTVQLPDHRIYTVVAAGATLRLADLTLRIDRLTWHRGAGTQPAPLGARVHAVAEVTIRNIGERDAKLLPTQIWLLDEGNRTHLAAPGGLIGRRVAAGATVHGRLVFPMPGRAPGSLLVYTFADARAIADATHVGVARYGT
jgi:hypothetical protein